MKGLFIKDTRLLFSQKRTAVMYILICLIMSFSIQGPFIVGYTVMLAGVIGVSTVSYDQADNGMPFLLTLPADRRDYVREKYLFCLILEVAAAVLGLILCVISSQIKTGSSVSMDDIRSAAVVIPLMITVVSFMIPINLKYGAEKARMVMLIAYGAIAAVSALAVAAINNIISGIDHSTLVRIKVFFDETLGETYFWTVPLVLTVLSLAIMYISYRISTKILADKEY